MQSMAPGGDSYRGVQNQAQFVDLLPQNLGRLFVAMSGDIPPKGGAGAGVETPQAHKKIHNLICSSPWEV